MTICSSITYEYCWHGVGMWGHDASLRNSVAVEVRERFRCFQAFLCFCGLRIAAVSWKCSLTFTCQSPIASIVHTWIMGLLLDSSIRICIQHHNLRLLLAPTLHLPHSAHSRTPRPPPPAPPPRSHSTSPLPSRPSSPTNTHITSDHS